MDTFKDSLNRLRYEVDDSPAGDKERRASNVDDDYKDSLNRLRYTVDDGQDDSSLLRRASTSSTGSHRDFSDQYLDRVMKR